MPGGSDIRELYRLAADARRMAEASGVTPAERADLLEVERRWLALARKDDLRSISADAVAARASASRRRSTSRRSARSAGVTPDASAMRRASAARR